MQETYKALMALKNKIVRLESIEKKMAEIEEVIEIAGIGQGADLEAYYKIQQIVRKDK